MEGKGHHASFYVVLLFYVRSRTDKFECPPKTHAETENVKAFITFLYVMESGTGSPILTDDRNARLLAQFLVSLIVQDRTPVSLAVKASFRIAGREKNAIVLCWQARTIWHRKWYLPGIKQESLNPRPD